MMQISMIIDPHSLSPDDCIYDAVLFGDGRTNGRTNERTDGKADSRSWIKSQARSSNMAPERPYIGQKPFHQNSLFLFCSRKRTLVLRFTQLLTGHAQKVICLDHIKTSM